ncbi:Zn-finger nucleic acid-binding protein [Paraburkholderia sp. Clong3]|uniref:TFIIB-type zinc ribbon-containing protein n=1 Tax=Paraburkholderia sp. Clong3 TaxID=2991061 RepID=UPI003D2080F8
MKCPVCKTPDLLMTERQNIEIDYCPTCRGVWLDRGELDKLLTQMQDTPEPDNRSNQAERDERYGDRDGHHDQQRGRRNDSYHGDQRKHYDPRRKKKSLFDMFDFD